MTEASSEESREGAESQEETETGREDRAAPSKARRAASKVTRQEVEDSESGGTGGEGRTPINETTRDGLFTLIRRIFSEGIELDREEALITIAREVGFKRICPEVRSMVESSLNAALRRYILRQEKGFVMRDSQSIEDYHRDFLKRTLLSVMGRGWEEQEEIIRNSARHLGFARTGSKIVSAFKSAINGLIRQGLLERNGTRLRKLR